jgi:hypothetical protein
MKEGNMLMSSRSQEDSGVTGAASNILIAVKLFLL